jgi:(1->4)-alpha-D-glucan 1-alpha-D-glucosylmutase
MTTHTHPRIPSSTYRLQFHAGFTFRDALNIVDYLRDLGVTDIYASPYFQAAPDSTHGYDVADHNRINPAIGDQSDFRALCDRLRKNDMGQVLDFVPNHMGIGQSLNTWWMEVLEDGLASPYAGYFDIDWHPGKEALEDRVLLPILGDRYGNVLEKGAFALSFVGGAFFLRYYETRLPLRPRSYPFILRRVMAEVGEEHSGELREIVAILSDPAAKTRAKARLKELSEADPALAAAIDRTLRKLEGSPGDPASFDDLHALLEDQVYRLSYWRVAAEEINYRRFFDINTLAAIRVEIPEVFSAAHQLVFELLARGDVTGLRLDHIDGLWDPRAYLKQLQACHGQLAGTDDPRGLYVVVEKILDVTGESLPSDWPVHGTTGYEFANQVVQCLTDASAEKSFTRCYDRFIGRPSDFATLVYEKKKQTMQNALGSEIAALGRMLDELSEMHRHFRDCTRNLLTTAIREVMACFPVYRTYASDDGTLSAEDEKNILRAVSAARRRNPSMEKVVFDFLRAVLLLRLPEGLSDDQRRAHFRFVRKFQQCSGPVMAKGLEDTAFYIYNRLIALNEVGGNPGLFGIDVKKFHTLSKTRLEKTPHSLLATSTHDTKRSEDVRMRLAALSEMPGEWRDAVKRWSKLNKKHLTSVGGEPAPSRNEEYLLYQILLGAWPLRQEDHESFPERIQAYMTKALKEAKINSSWTEPNEEWETATSQFVERILSPVTGAEFLETFRPFADRLAKLGALNTLTQTILKITSPGVPDFYQGTEIWDFSLVDPDNRRPVDYAARRALLDQIQTKPLESLLEDWPSGAIKLAVIRTLLSFRREHADFFRLAGYTPLAVTGKFRKHLIAFSRRHGTRELVVVVPRLCAGFASFPLGETWEDTSVAHSAGGFDLLARRAVAAEASQLPVANLFASLPFAVLTREQPSLESSL